MESKECYRCKKVKLVECFNEAKRHPTGFSSWCKSCIKEYDHKRHINNREKILKQKKARRIMIREWVDELKSNFGCEICDENHIACLDFHHKDPNTKEFNFGDLKRRGFSKEKILKEIKKCIVLCSNCHRKLHWKERQRNVG